MTTVTSDQTIEQTMSEFVIPCEDANIHATAYQPLDEPAAYAIWLRGRCVCGVRVEGMVFMCQPCFLTRGRSGWRMRHMFSLDEDGTTLPGCGRLYVAPPVKIEIIRRDQ